MQYKLSHLPLVKILLPLLMGIVAFHFFTTSYAILIISSLILFLCVIVSHVSIMHPYAKRANAVLISVFLFLLGGCMISATQYKNQPFHFSKYKAVFVKAVIYTPIEEKENTYKTILQINTVIDSSRAVHYSNGKIMVYFKKSPNVQQLEIGDELLIALSPKPIDTPKNPGQFNYAEFLAHKGVYHQAYVRESDWIITQKHKAFTILRISNTVGEYVQSILKKYIPGKAHFTLADGILLGHRADIDLELYNAFAYTGILHILSVSGLHVGIIYGMLLFLLSFIPDKNRKIKIGKFIFIFCFIWLFTFVTGFSAACVRAAILFSLLNFGQLIKEHTNNLNLLAGAALLQLFINPNNVFDIGFQLSYLAMLGLFIFTQPIYALFYSKYKLIDWTWKLWAASIGAQVFTVPLSIYYFGNFPTYFLFANIFAIPLSTLILWMSLALLPLSIIPFAAKIIGWIDAWIVELFIQFTYFFSHLPLGKIYNLYLSPLQVILLMSASALLAFSVMHRKAKYAIICICVWLGVIGISYFHAIAQWQKTELILYSVPKNFVLGIKHQNRQLILYKDSISDKLYSFNIQNAHRKYRTDEIEKRFLSDSINEKQVYLKENLAVIYNIPFYFLTKGNTRKTFTSPLEIDYLVISDNCYLDIESVKANYKYKNLILSSDNDTRHLNIYRKILNANRLPFIDLSEKYIEIPI